MHVEHPFFSSIFAHHPDGIAVLGREGQFKAINPSLERLVGRRIEPPVGMAELAELLVPDPAHRAEALRTWEQDLALASPPSHVLAFQHASGEWRWGRFQQAHLPNGDILISCVEFTAQRLHELEALEAKERYRALVHASPDPVTVTDLAGRIVEVSQRAVEWYGFGTAAELIGLSAFELIAPETRPQAAVNLAETLRTGWGRLVGEALRKDGSRFVAELTASLVRDADGAPIAFVGVTRDITQSRAAEQALLARNEELARANEELARLQRAKDELVATLSHELRTPLVTGIGYLEMLLDGELGKLTARGQRRMQVALRNLRRLSRLIDDLLQYNRVVQSAQRYSPALQRVDVLEVIDECVTELLARTRRRRRSLVVDVAPELPRASADPELLRTVIANLLDNAARHAGARTQIRICARQRDGRVELAIEDDGLGMDAASQLRAFDPFYQAGENREGLGLGLFIVRAILEAHGSQVMLESAPGKGTTIRFSLAAEGRERG